MTITDIDLTIKARITQLLTELEMALKEAEARGWHVNIHTEYTGMSQFPKRPIGIHLSRNEIL